MRSLPRLITLSVALAAIPGILNAQNFLRNCSLGARSSVHARYDLVNHVGDIIQYTEKITKRDDYSQGHYTLDLDKKYNFTSYRITMPRSSSLGVFGVGCDVGANLKLELSFSRGVSYGTVSGTINSAPDTIRWLRPTWQSQPLPVLNLETCSDELGEWNGLPCITPIPYWSNDRYSSNAVDALAAYTLLARKGFTVEALGGFTFNRMRYTFVTGERQFARIKVYMFVREEEGGKAYASEYAFNNDIFLETTSTTRATFFGPAFGVRANKSMGRLRLRATLRHDILREQGADSVAFIDIDDIHDCLRNLETGTVYWCTNNKLDGSVNLGNARSGFSSRTLGEVDASLRVNKRADFNFGFFVSRNSAHLTQQLVKQWGLSSNKAPDAMELSSLPRKGGDPTGFGVSGFSVGVTLRPF